jgi:indolepyruvate ferredoxin oxidoreductase beta subunit
MDEVRAQVNAKPDQILHVVEYMHPRWEELCDTLPVGLGERLAHGGAVKRLFAPMFEKGRHVRTTSVGWALVLRLLASRRRARRGTRRYAHENARIEAWLALVRDAAGTDYESAIELAQCQNLVKGYGETQARGLRKFASLTESWHMLRTRADAARILRQLRQAALRDEDGTSLAQAMRKLA